MTEHEEGDREVRAALCLQPYTVAGVSAVCLRQRHDDDDHRGSADPSLIAWAKEKP